MDDTISILSLILAFATGALAPIILWIRDSSKRKLEAARAERAWVQREGEWKRREVEWRQQDEQWEYQESKQKHDELAQAFDIHADLSQLQVFEALTKASNDASARQYVVRLHERASYRFKTFSDDFALPEDVVTMVTTALTTINRSLPRETAAAQQAFSDKVALKQNHAKNSDVQARIDEFATRLVGRPVNRNERVDVLKEFSDVANSVRVSRGGQGVEMVLPDGSHKIWFAGNGRGDVPAVIVHFDSKGCTLDSSKAGELKSRLASHANTGSELAEAFVDELRDFATSGGQCGCGAPLSFPAVVRV